MRDPQATIAATHPFSPVFELAGGSPRQGATWDELPKTTQPVTPDEPLREVLRRASASIGLTIGPDALRIENELREGEERPARSSDPADWLVFVGFRQEDDDEVITQAGGIPIRKWNTRIHHRVAVVRNEEGEAVWKRPPFDATIAELVDAHSVGLIEGDPLQIYLVPSIPQGAFGLGGEWNLFIEHLKTLWELTSLASTIGGAVAAGSLLKDLLERRKSKPTEVLERRSTAWIERGGAPADIIHLLSARPRKADEIAALLGCTGEEAEAILWALGFSFDERGETWIQGGDDASQVIADDLELSFTDALEWAKTDELFREAIERRLGEIARGATPPSADEERKALRDRFFDQR